MHTHLMHIFNSSEVLKSFDINFDINSILHNDIIPEWKDILNRSSEFLFLYDHNICNIKDIYFITKILHKYRIIKYYNDIIYYFIWKIVKLDKKITPKILHSNLNGDIINDIIEYNSDFKNILKYLIFGINDDLCSDDFLFSINLYNKMIHEQKLGKIEICRFIPIISAIPIIPIIPIIPVKYELMDVIKHIYSYCNPKLICIYAAYYGKIGILKWMRSINYQIDNDICTAAARGGHLDILQWAFELGLLIDSDTMMYASKYGHFNIIEWLWNNNIMNDITNTDICAYASKGGHFGILKWAYEKGFKMDQWVCTFAAEKGYFDIIKWAKSNGCSWDEYTTTNAAFYGNFDILVWLLKEGCPWNNDMIIGAKNNNHYDICDWFLKNGYS